MYTVRQGFRYQKGQQYFNHPQSLDEVHNLDKIRNRKQSDYNDRPIQRGPVIERRDRRNWGRQNPEMHLSKTLSFLLRHGAERQGFKFMAGGFLYVEEILRKMESLESFCEEDVKKIVKNNDKQRFALDEDSEGRLMIRANQGHSIEVNNLELTPITNANEAESVVHGTYWESWEIIKFQGLSRMRRNHIHFATGEPGDNAVISGMRSTCEVMIFIDIKKALSDGLKFFRSANNVLLSPGNKDGIIRPFYFEKIVKRTPSL